jgi:nucleotide-binding universal stress UspA family protein
MYKRILIPVENSATDQAMLDHIQPMARLMGSRLVLVCVAHGWAARNYDKLNLRESGEMTQDREYLRTLCDSLRNKGFDTDYILAHGEPSAEIIRIAAETQADLIAMSTHGHRFVSDVVYGSVSDVVRHSVDIPVLLLKARK